MEELSLYEFTSRIADYHVKSFSIDWKDQSQPIVKMSGMSFNLAFTNSIIITRAAAGLFDMTFEVVGNGGSFTVSNIKRITWEDVNEMESIVRLYFEDNNRIPILLYSKSE